MRTEYFGLVFYFSLLSLVFLETKSHSLDEPLILTAVFPSPFPESGDCGFALPPEAQSKEHSVVLKSRAGFFLLANNGLRRPVCAHLCWVGIEKQLRSFSVIEGLRQ